MIDNGLTSIPARFGLFLIRQYQHYISPLLGDVCRFKPSCSHYEAIEKYGLIKGSFMGALRILRCNPFNKGGYDPVK